MVLDEASRVPDTLYEILQEGLYEQTVQPLASEEVTVARLLRVHRDWLNGGFAQTFYNLEAIGVPFEPYVLSYDEIGLARAAAIVRQAASRWEVGKFPTAEVFIERSEELYGDYESLDTAYKGVTYGDLPDDMIEAAVVQYVQRHSAAFANSLKRANT